MAVRGWRKVHQLDGAHLSVSLVKASTRRAAFTLIELLVVVAVIMLLLGILLPSLSAARARAKASVCSANLHRLGTAMLSYVNSNGDKLPPFRLVSASPVPGVGAYVNRWGRSKPRWHWFVDQEEVRAVIDPEPFREEIEQSGSFGDSSVGRDGQSGLQMTNNYFVCPSLDGEHELSERNGAYGYNWQYLGNSRQDPRGRWLNFPVNITRLRSAGLTVLLADSRGAGRLHGNHSYTLDPPRLAVERSADKFGPGREDVPSGLDPALYQYSPVEMRHTDRGNVAFIDGHAQPMKLDELGYHLNDDGVPMPMLSADGTGAAVSNKLWNGEGQDRVTLTQNR